MMRALVIVSALAVLFLFAVNLSSLGVFSAGELGFSEREASSLLSDYASGRFAPSGIADFINGRHPAVGQPSLVGAVVASFTPSPSPN